MNRSRSMQFSADIVDEQKDFVASIKIFSFLKKISFAYLPCLLSHNSAADRAGELFKTSVDAVTFAV